MDTKELAAEFKKSFDELKEIMEQQREELELHSEVLEAIVNKQK